MTRHILMTASLLATTAALSACGGASDSVASMPAPPTLAATTPTPAPVAPATASPATGQAVSTAAFYGQNQLRGDYIPRFRQLGTEQVHLDYDQASGTYTLTGPFVALSGVPGAGVRTVAFNTATNTGPASTPGDEPTNFTYYRQASGTSEHPQKDELQLLRTGSGNTRIQLSYLSYGLWISEKRDYDIINFSNLIFVHGIETTPADMPQTGSATYTGIVDGYAHGAIPAGDPSGGYVVATDRLLGSTGTLAADFASGAVTASLQLKGTRFTFGAFTGSGTIGSGTNHYSGTFGGTGVSGGFEGSFFGPRASEAGYSFSLSQTSALDSNFPVRASGVFVGNH